LHIGHEELLHFGTIRHISRQNKVAKYGLCGFYIAPTGDRLNKHDNPKYGNKNSKFVTQDFPRNYELARKLKPGNIDASNGWVSYDSNQKIRRFITDSTYCNIDSWLTVL
jgi:hypothetical protein